ncbi:uncharacterized protein LOC105696125 isoform X2 [Orussus abietinus]|uniref:uncharacterized protein LOC105696125 isoform X2 n=1 Tax=Orussus abietinus TaxID=222816 RepID=UPI0006269DF9|nr:uncharacterized protein LOC105696125 isoform X2 [Orussus abietinus]
MDSIIDSGSEVSAMIEKSSFPECTIFCIILLQLCNPSYAGFNIDIHGSIPNDAEEYSDCLEKIGRVLFSDTKSIILVSNNSSTPTLGMFKNIARVLVIGNPLNLLSDEFSEGRAFIYLEEENIEKDLALLRVLAQLHPRKFHAVIVAINKRMDDDSKFDLLKTVTNYLSDIERRAVILLRDGTKEVKIYGYSKFIEGRCGDVSVIDYGFCNDDAVLKVDPRIPNLQGCKLKLGVTPIAPYWRSAFINNEWVFEAIEWNLMKTIIKKLNATAELIPSLDANFTRQQVQKKVFDVALGSLLLFNIEDVTHSKVYMFWPCKIVMPVERLEPLWIHITTPFQVQVWTMLFFTFTLCFTLIMMVPIIPKKMRKARIITIFLGVGRIEKKYRNPEKVYLFTWSFCGYTVTQVYFASLTQKVIVGNYVLNIRTLDNLEKDNYPVAGSAYLKEYFQEANPNLYNKYQTFNRSMLIHVLLDVLHHRQKIAVFTNQMMITLMIDKKKHQQIHIMPDDFRLYLISMVLTKTTTIETACNKIISIIQAGGFFRHWLREFKGNPKLPFHPSMPLNGHEDDLDDEEKTNRPRILKIEDTHGIFIIFGMGTFVSIVIFIAEILISKCKMTVQYTLPL